MLGGVAENFLILFLIAGVPALSLVSARQEGLRQAPRAALYFSAALSQWFLAGAAILVVWIGGARFRVLGLRVIPLAVVAGWGIALAATAVAGLGFSLFLEKRGWWPAEPEIVRLLIPETGREKLWAVIGLAPTAALCEEFLYRGFLLAALTGMFHSAGLGLAAASVAFGLAHSYQGPGGIARAALLGALLAVPVLRTGSLYPAMLAHFLIDAVALAWLGPRFLKRQAAS